MVVLLRDEGLIRCQMWGDIFFVGILVSLATLLVLDVALPDLIEGSRGILWAQTITLRRF